VKEREWSSYTWCGLTQSRGESLCQVFRGSAAVREGSGDNAVGGRGQSLKVELRLEASRSDTQGALKHGGFGSVRRESTTRRQEKGTVIEGCN
jgi:hypothetical protein